jgi:hypothetical protein
MNDEQMLLNQNADFIRQINDHRFGIFDLAIAQYRERFPNDPRQPDKNCCYIDGGEGVLLEDDEGRVVAEYGLSLKRRGNRRSVNLQFVYSYHTCQSRIDN